jgi:tetratricopeptide (TPR) repeat protein
MRGSGPEVGSFAEPVAAVHRTVVVVDVEGFGDRRRTDPQRVEVRRGLYRVLRAAFGRAGVAWDDCYHEDRGDAVFVLVPAAVPKAVWVDVVPGALVEAVRAHNADHRPEERFRLRMAVHAGEVRYDEHGVAGTAVNLTFRLLDAPPVRAMLAGSPGVLALIVSGWFFEEVVRHSDTVDPTTFRPVRVVVKETSAVGWAALPDHSHPPDPALSADHAFEPPRQLPASPPAFTGRTDALDLLTATLGGPGATVLISAVGGAGGIGKTSLALRWAHDHVDLFPDGQLFVDLRGFSPDGPPMSPAVAVRGFLDALGADPGRLPVDLHAQAALFRSTVAGRRVLIVLDNARDSAQVESLLPGSPTCAVLVTSRKVLNGLVATHGAHHLTLDVLTSVEAHDLLVRRLGAARVAAEPGAVAELVGFCRGFPLALGIIAGHAQARPHVPLAEFAVELRDLGLGALENDDPAASLPTVLSWSYDALTAEQRTTFGLLAVAPGPDIGLPAATSLTGLTPTRTRRMLRDLEDASLLGRDADGRYSMHDLIRRYAADTADQPDAALRRVVDFYLHTAHAAAALLDPHATPIPLAPAEPGCRPHHPSTGTEALVWFDAEHQALLATQHTATAQGRHQAAWHLAWTLTPFHDRRGHRHDNLAVWRVGLGAAARLDDPITRTLAHRFLGTANADLGRHDEAIGHLRQALSLAERHRDEVNQARIHRMLAQAWGQQDDNERALEHATRALALNRSVGEPVVQADGLNTVGWFAARLGDYDRAREHCQAALALHQLHDDPEGEASALDSLANIDYHTGHHRESIEHYRRALALFRDIDNTFQVADVLDGLGHPHAALGEHDEARAAWEDALGMYLMQGRDDDEERVRRQLGALGG